MPCRRVQTTERANAFVSTCAGCWHIDQLLIMRVRIVHSTGFHSISACCVGCSCLQPMSQHHLACTQHYGAPYGSSP